MGKWSNNALVIDVYHNTPILDLTKLKGVVDGIIVKMGGSESSPSLLPYDGYPTKEGPPYNPYYDDKFSYWVQVAYDLDIPCMAYWNVGPRVYAERNIDANALSKMTNDKHPVLQMILRQAKAGNWFKKFNALFFDLEDYSYWPGLPESPKLGINAFWLKTYIEDLRERLVNLMRLGQFPTMRLGVYSRKSFIDEVESTDLQLGTWFENRPEMLLWTANYPTLTIPADTYQMLKTVRPLDNHNPIPFGVSSKQPDRPWDFWQFNGTRLDMSLFNGTKEQLNTMLNYVSTVETSSASASASPSSLSSTNSPSEENDDVIMRLDAIGTIVSDMNKKVNEIRAKFS
jgi:hypothetical protein